MKMPNNIIAVHTSDGRLLTEQEQYDLAVSFFPIITIMEEKLKEELAKPILDET